MKRGMLLLVGFTGSALAALLLVCTAARSAGLGNSSLRLPCDVEQTPLQVLELISYDGAYVEDGSYRQVRNVAAVIVYNTSDRMLERGAVKLQQGGRLMVFSFTWLPPEGRLLVLENRGVDYRNEPVSACWGWSITGDTEQRLRVEEAGRTSLALTNICGETVERAFVYYKNYDPERQLLIGGMTYCVQVEQLEPGHRAVLPAFRYLSGRSMVVQ